MRKIGRNAPCPCGSGKKYKHCHGNFAAAAQLPALVAHVFERHQAQERIRQAQQGLGRPILGMKHSDHQIVAVGNTIYWSKNWKTFPDFLGDYLKEKLGPEWGDAEIKKPFAERHTIIQWYDRYCREQQKTVTIPGEVRTGDVTGIVAAYLGVAYSLYLLDHNVELQERLIKRLKNPGNFQGAFYELIVASTLIRAGFTLTLEDEQNGDEGKHCEFAAVSARTGKRYWVEAKMRSVAGLFGKNEKDGSNDPDPISRLIPHLNAALAKPAADERLIFIDLNGEPEFDAAGKPVWHDRAIARIERYEEKELEAGKTAYLFVTNIGFHRRLDDIPHLSAAPFGLGLPDFNRPGEYRLSELHRRRQKHADAYYIGEAFMEYTKFPNNFDGSLPSEINGQNSNRLMLGETYFFEDVAPNGLVATVTAASVNETEKSVMIGTDSGHVPARVERR